MTREQVNNRWHSLPFWQRALIECSVMAFAYLVVDVIWDGRTASVGWSLFRGAGVGFVCAVLDHAFFGRQGKRANRGG
jgi:hypothetical protein